MKKRILKELKKSGKTRKQLRKTLKVNNFFKRYSFIKALNELLNNDNIYECYGGYYAINKEVA